MAPTCRGEPWSAVANDQSSRVGCRDITAHFVIDMLESVPASRFRVHWESQQDLEPDHDLYIQQVIFIAIAVIVRYDIVAIGQHQTRHFA